MQCFTHRKRTFRSKILHVTIRKPSNLVTWWTLCINIVMDEQGAARALVMLTALAEKEEERTERMLQETKIPLSSGEETCATKDGRNFYSTKFLKFDEKSEQNIT